MALTYTYLKYKDENSIINNGDTFINYTVDRVSASSTTTVKAGMIGVNKNVILNFTLDGKYVVSLDNAIDPVESITIYSYVQLLNSLITTVEGIICGCSKCDECGECNECENYLSAFMKSYSFAVLNQPRYKDYLDTLLADSADEINDSVLCSILHEKVYGNVTTKDVMLKLIANYYLAFYYKDLRVATDSAEKTYVQDKYKFSKISGCIKKLGLFLTDPTPSKAIHLIYNEVLEAACCEYVNGGGVLPTTTTLPPLPGTTTTTLPTTSTTTSTTTTLTPVAQCLTGMVIETIYLHQTSDLLGLPIGYTHPCPDNINKHECNGALTEVLGNGIFLGESKMNNLYSPTLGSQTPQGTHICADYNNTPAPLNPGFSWDLKSRYSRIEVSQAQAIDIAQVSGSSLIDFSLAFAVDTYQSSCSTAHAAVTWVRITNSQGEVIYNGCPVGNFAQVNVCNPAN